MHGLLHSSELIEEQRTVYGESAMDQTLHKSNLFSRRADPPTICMHAINNYIRSCPIDTHVLCCYYPLPVQRNVTLKTS